MANKKVTVEVDIEIEPSLKALKELKKELRNAAAGSAEFNKISEQIRDVEDALESGKVGAEDFLGTLEKADGPLGMLGRGIKQAEITFSSFNTALKASVIGLIAAAVGGLVAAFMKNEEAMKKLEPLFIAFEKILGGIFRAFEPLIDSFVELAEDVLPYVTQGIGMFYSAIVALFTYIKTAGGAVIDFWTSLLSFDFEGVSNAIKKGFGSFEETGKAYTDSMKRFSAGTKEMTKTEKENAEKLAEIEKKKQEEREAAQKKLEEDRKKALEDKKKNLEINDKLDMVALEKQKAIELERAKTEKEKLDVEEKFATLSYNIQKKDIEDKRALYSKDTTEYKEYTAELIQLNTNFIKSKSDLSSKRKTILEQEITQVVTLLDSEVKARKDYESQVRQLELNAISDQTQKALASLEEKTAKEKEQLLKSKEDLLKIEQQALDKGAITKAQYDERTKTAEDDYQKGLTLIAKTNANEREKINQDELNKKKSERLKVIDEELNLLGLQSQSLIQGTRAYFDNRREIIDASERREIEAAEQTESSLLAIQKKYTEQRKQLKKDELAATGKIISETISSIASLTGVLASSYDKEAETSEKAFNQRKKLQKATALISAASGIIQILTQPSTLPSPFDFIVKGINAAALAVSTATQIKNIDKTSFQPQSSGTAGSGASNTGGTIQVQRRALGGIVSGPGTSTSDSIPALLSNGEFVVNARATESFEPLLNSINSFGLQPKFAAGGLFNPSSVTQPNGDVLKNSLSSLISEQPIKAYVTSNDITNQQQLDRLIKTRSMI